MWRWIKLISLIFLLFSCEEAIVMQLEEGNSLLVVEGILNDQEESTDIQITRSSSFYNKDGFEKISGAFLQIITPEDEKLQGVELSPGLYQCSGINIKHGSRYLLEININGEWLHGSVKIPEPVQIVELIQEDSKQYGSNIKHITVVFDDPPEMKNYYRVKMYRNHTHDLDEYVLIDDQVAPGGKMIVPFYHQKFFPGDSVQVELWNLAPETYQYFKVLKKAIGEASGGGAVGNPPSNMEGNCLGYFGAYAADKKDALITGNLKCLKFNAKGK